MTRADVKVGAGTPPVHGTSLADKLIDDLREALHDELAKNPQLEGQVEEFLVHMSAPLIHDLAAAIKNPLVRAVVEEAAHSLVRSTFASIGRV